MKRKWLSLRPTVWAITALVMIYQLAIVFEMQLALVLTLLLLSMLGTIYLVFRILKDPYSTDKTFDEFFYQDRDDLRRQGPD